MILIQLKVILTPLPKRCRPSTTNWFGLSRLCYENLICLCAKRGALKRRSTELNLILQQGEPKSC